MDSDDETEEIEAKPIVKKSGFAAFQMDDSEDNQATDSDEEAPVITKVRILWSRSFKLEILWHQNIHFSMRN